MGVSGNLTVPQNSNISGATSGKVKYGFSSGGNVALGYEPSMFNSSVGDVRAEFEAGYHALGVNKVIANGVTNSNPNGDFQMATFMGNVYYDFHTNTRFTPYIGAGLGDAHESFSKKNGLGNTSRNDDELAYQAMFGVSYTPESMPKTDWSLGYRYLGTTEPTFAAAGGTDVKFNSISTSNIELAFRYHF